MKIYALLHSREVLSDMDISKKATEANADAQKNIAEAEMQPVDESYNTDHDFHCDFPPCVVGVVSVIYDYMHIVSVISYIVKMFMLIISVFSYTNYVLVFVHFYQHVSAWCGIDLDL